MKKDTAKERQEKWRMRQGQKGKEPLTVWISKEEGKILDMLQKHYQEKNKSGVVSKIIREMEKVTYNDQPSPASSMKRLSDRIKKWRR